MRQTSIFPLTPKARDIKADIPDMSRLAILEKKDKRSLNEEGAETFMTTTNEHSTLIAIFADHEQANQSIDNLRHAGYGYDQIRLVERGTNSFVENLKSLFTGQTTTTTNSADDWTRIGVPEQDAHNYQSELDAGRSIVLIKAVSSPEQALSIMHQSGAYDIAFRWRAASPAMAQGTYNAQGANNPNAQPGTYNPDVAQGANNPNAQPGTYAPQPRPVNPQGERNA